MPYASHALRRRAITLLKAQCFQPALDQQPHAQDIFSDSLFMVTRHLHLAIFLNFI